MFQNKINDINKIVNTIVEDIFIISLSNDKIDVDKLTYLYRELVKIKNDIFTLMIDEKQLDEYNSIKFKICEATITVKIMIKEKLGLSTTNEKLLLQDLYKATV